MKQFLKVKISKTVSLSSKPQCSANHLLFFFFNHPPFQGMEALKGTNRLDALEPQIILKQGE